MEMDRNGKIGNRLCEPRQAGRSNLTNAMLNHNQIIRTFITVAIFFAGCPHVFADPQTFSGHVEQGQLYEHELDGGLIFRLVPNSAGNPPGWVITVAPKDHSRDDYVWVVTPPYRSSNPRYVDISYGVSAREAVDWSPREFVFVTNETDYKTASDAVNILLWPYSYTEKEVDVARTNLDAVKKAKGTFRITDALLKAGIDGIEEIEGLSFKVELDASL
jgi:hypothetical protein